MTLSKLLGLPELTHHNYVVLRKIKEYPNKTLYELRKLLEWKCDRTALHTLVRTFKEKDYITISEIVKGSLITNQCTITNKGTDALQESIDFYNPKK